MTTRHIPRLDFNLENFKAPRRATQKCLLCGETTREGKVYCSEHVEESTYVTDVQARYAAIQSELRKIKELGIKAITPDSYFVSEILRALHIEDGLQFGELSHESDVPYDILPHYLDKLQIWGLIEIEHERNTRKTPVIFLLEEPRPLYTAPELAKKLGINVFKVKRAVKHGVPHVNIGGRNYFEPRKFMAWKSKRRLEITAKLIETGNKARKAKLEKFKNDVKKKNKSKNLLTIEETAEAMGVSKDTVQYWVKKGAPNYPEKSGLLGGSAVRNNVRFFNLEEIQAWYKEFRENYNEARRSANMYKNWDEIFKDAEDLGLVAAAKKHGVNQAVLRKKIKEAKPIELKPPTPNSTRTVPLTEATKILGLKYGVLSKWVNRMGAPHERVTMFHTARHRILVDPDEIRAWNEQRGSRKMPIKRRGNRR